ncbi:hypothetical protein [Ancylobacter aquaticus]|uniref:hypothetical protein n=1 Tax=Ancylobacter aquaticus TaxID=100 RepID=UPI00104B1CAF|nr:hypothetical protein [Ancylobacter aquaticus]
MASGVGFLGAAGRFGAVGLVARWRAALAAGAGDSAATLLAVAFFAATLRAGGTAAGTEAAGTGAATCSGARFRTAFFAAGAGDSLRSVRAVLVPGADVAGVDVAGVDGVLVLRRLLTACPRGLVRS